ncbi:MAG: hypothetical protein D6679_12785 [Candidatus Hydrogenedentota bacterium]|nr:MAG: hypothetical protein D6679_12785 [Candidatus Hydrogenedentota bacterium]
MIGDAEVSSVGACFLEEPCSDDEVIMVVGAVEQMKADEEALRSTARDGKTRAALYIFRRPSVTAGRNASVNEEMLERWRCAGHEFARRPTGGGILRHDGDLCFGVAFPESTEAAIRGTGRHLERVSEAWRAALSKQGIIVARAERPLVRAPRFCYTAGVGAELCLDGTKILGLAARAIRGGVLVQGTLSTGRIDPELDRTLVGAGPRISLRERCDCAELARNFREILLKRNPLLV